MQTQVIRYHDVCVGHRVVGHEGKCKFLHGHNYRIHFTVQPKDGELDDIGRVVDFGVVKEKLCMWLEEKWDHQFLTYQEDPLMLGLARAIHDDKFETAFDNSSQAELHRNIWFNSFYVMPYNPTSENMAKYLLTVIGPQQLKGTGLVLTSVKVEETRKCHAEVSL